MERGREGGKGTGGEGRKIGVWRLAGWDKGRYDYGRGMALCFGVDMPLLWD
jgi:hypothetical protein